MGARFVELVVILESGCWEWQGSVASNGYGVLWVGDNNVGAHRLSYELFIGPLPGGANVCHWCDVTLCVNPEHLFVGTTQDNTADRHSKERDARGEGHGNAKLTDEAVRTIRSEVAMGRSQVSLARRFNVTRETISSVVRRKTWTHLH